MGLFSVRRCLTNARTFVNHCRENPKEAAKSVAFHSAHYVGNTAILLAASYQAGTRVSDTLNMRVSVDGANIDVGGLSSRFGYSANCVTAALAISGMALKTAANRYLSPSRVHQEAVPSDNGAGERVEDSNEERERAGSTGSQGRGGLAAASGEEDELHAGRERAGSAGSAGRAKPRDGAAFGKESDDDLPTERKRSGSTGSQGRGGFFAGGSEVGAVDLLTGSLRVGQPSDEIRGDPLSESALDSSRLGDSSVFEPPGVEGEDEESGRASSERRGSADSREGRDLGQSLTLSDQAAQESGDDLD